MTTTEYLELKARLSKATSILSLIKKFGAEITWYDVIINKAREQNQTKRELWAEEKLKYYTQKLIEAKLQFKEL